MLRALRALLSLVALLAAPAAWASCGSQSYTYFAQPDAGGTMRFYQTSNNAQMDQNWVNNLQNNGLGAGNSLRVKAGTLTNTFGGLQDSNTICVDSGATFRPQNGLNQAKGTFINYGNLIIPQGSYAADFVIDNFAYFESSSNFNTNAAMTFRNRPGADAIFKAAFQVGNGSTILNDGRMIANQNFQTDAGATLTNNFEIITRTQFNTAGTTHNYGRVHAEDFININGGSYTHNYCSLISDKGFNNNGSTVDNHGMVFINRPGTSTSYHWHNNGTFRMGVNALVYGWTFSNNANITNLNNQGGGKFYFQDPDGILDAQQTVNQGPFTGLSSTNRIVFYDTTRSGSNIFDAQNTNPTNTVRTQFTPPPMDWAAPTCSPLIRQVMYDPDPPSVTYDYGDAPGSYGNPYHEITAATSGIYLGNVKPDWDGSPAPASPAFGGFGTANADGDDLSINDDEDGITAMPTIARGALTTLNIKVNGSGYLNAWIDYDGNGTFGNDTNEQIALNVRDDGGGGAGDNDASGNGNIQLKFTPPAGANIKTYIRLRWSAQQNLNPTQSSTSGEVEDYAFTFGLAPEPELPPGGGPGANGGTTPSSCASPQTVTIYPSNAQAVASPSGAASTNVTNAANALGAISMKGGYASTTNSAQLASTSSVLVLDLTGQGSNLVPAYADITLSIARGDSNSRLLVQVWTGIAWADVGSWGAGTNNNDFSNGVLNRVMFERSSAVRYVRFVVQAGSFWIDGVATADICGPMGSATLTVVKSSQAATTGGFMIPSNDVIYSILVSNTGTQAADANSIVLIDTLPTHLTFRNSAFGAAGTNAVVFSQTGTGMSFTYGTDVRYSSAAAAPSSFANCDYTPPNPVPVYDANIKHVCIKPSGTLAPSSQFTVQFKTQIK